MMSVPFVFVGPLVVIAALAPGGNTTGFLTTVSIKEVALPRLPVEVKTKTSSVSEGQDDGTVSFEASRLDDPDTEFIVFNSGHSTQSNPRTIQEVRRILLDALER